MCTREFRREDDGGKQREGLREVAKRSIQASGHTPQRLPQVGQEGEQETESGDVDQSFEVASEGDNSNQCPNIQGVAQTGNSQNQLDLVQDSSIVDDFEFDEVSSTIDESPANTATCDQQVNQAASASG
jgi:phosphoglycerate-specific signal transduction histidine kinase